MTGAIFVYGDWEALNGPSLIGRLNVEMLRGKEVFSFEYDEKWLSTKKNILFDPDLQLFRGSSDKPLFGIFTDSCPDRWGRMLLQRNEALNAKKEGRTVRKLNESDFLIGIEDFSRMGALRFKTERDGDFLAVSGENSVPLWTSIRELERAAFILDSQDEDDSDTMRRLRMLLSPGSSLGGARPKASVRDTDGSLWIAKFPSGKDDRDVGCWEMVTHELAAGCSLNVPSAMRKKCSDNGTTFLTKRFDRTSEGQRIHFLSAMTALGKIDETDSESGISYLDIASFIMQYSSSPSEDLKELWKRIVFSIAVSNTDDHLRNHGFLLTPRGLRLSPMYDVNPNPGGTGLSLNIDEYDNALDYDTAIAASGYYELSKDKAAGIVREIRKAVSLWESVASDMGIPRSETEYMRSCFRV